MQERKRSGRKRERQLRGGRLGYTRWTEGFFTSNHLSTELQAVHTFVATHPLHTRNLTPRKNPAAAKSLPRTRLAPHSWSAGNESLCPQSSRKCSLSAKAAQTKKTGLLLC